MDEEDDASWGTLDAVGADDPAGVLGEAEAEGRVSRPGRKRAGRQLGGHRDGLQRTNQQ